MALLAHLQLGDNMARHYFKEYLVADCHLHFTRHHNHFKPDTDAKCVKVELVVEAPGKEDLNLYEWYVNDETLSGRVVFDLLPMPDDSSMVKYVEFEEARCYSIEEEYHVDSQRRRLIRLSLTAEKMTVNDIEFVDFYA